MLEKTVYQLVSLKKQLYYYFTPKTEGSSPFAEEMNRMNRAKLVREKIKKEMQPQIVLPLPPPPVMIHW